MDKELFKKVVIAILVMVCFGYVGNIYLLGSKRRRVKSLEEEIVSVVREIEKCRKAQKREEALKQEVADLERRFEVIKAVLPKEDEIPGLIRQVSKLAYYNRVDYTLFKRGKEKVTNKGYATLDIAIEFRGSYPQLVSIVRGVSGMKRLVKPVVMKVAYAQKKAVLENPLLKVKCMLETYRYVPVSKREGKHGKGKR